MNIYGWFKQQEHKQQENLSKQQVDLPNCRQQKMKRLIPFQLYFTYFIASKISKSFTIFQYRPVVSL